MLFKGTAIHILLYMTALRYVTHYPSSVSVFSLESALLVTNIVCHIGVHKVCYYLKIYCIITTTTKTCSSFNMLLHHNENVKMQHLQILIN